MCPLHQGWSGLVLGSNQHIYDFLRIYGFLRAAGERGRARRASTNQVTAGRAGDSLAVAVEVCKHTGKWEKLRGNEG